MRSLVRLAATSVAAASLVLGTLVAPASAATASPIDITSVSVKASSSYEGNTISRKTKGYYVTTKATGAVAEGDWADVHGDVYRGATKVASNFHLGYVYSGGSYLADRYLEAKNSWGRGTFTIKNVRVTLEDYDPATGAETVRTFADKSVAGGTFVMKSAVKGSVPGGYVFTISAKGTKKVVKVGLQVFTVTKGWEPYQGKAVKIQQKKSGKWVTKKTVKLDKKGKATYKFTSAKKYKYRLSIAATSTVMGGVSQSTGTKY